MRHCLVDLYKSSDSSATVEIGLTLGVVHAQIHDPQNQHILTIEYNQIFHHKQVVNKGTHVIVCGETYCYSYLSLGHGTVHYHLIHINYLKPEQLQLTFRYLVSGIIQWISMIMTPGLVQPLSGPLEAIASGERIVFFFCDVAAEENTCLSVSKSQESIYVSYLHVCKSKSYSKCTMQISDNSCEEKKYKYRTEIMKKISNVKTQYIKLKFDVQVVAL